MAACFQSDIENAVGFQRPVNPCQIGRHVGARGVEKAETCPDTIIESVVCQLVKAHLPHFDAVQLLCHGGHVG